jgi:FMN phosphatase YigB (HAD superfamily)
MFDSQGLKALLIDIDGTIVRYKPGVEPYTLLDVIRNAGIHLCGFSAEETAQRIENVRGSVQWWHWSDFIVALELNPKQFWTYALEVERTYLEPTGTEMCSALQRLKDAGLLLYVTSNNPSSGILHKLSLAGLATIQGSSLFSQLLGATELQAMKWETVYWQKVLAHIGLNAEEVAVVGDNPHDDCTVPLSVGISHSFLVDRYQNRSALNSSSTTWVMDFDQLANTILNVPLTRLASASNRKMVGTTKLHIEHRIKQTSYTSE